MSWRPPIPVGYLESIQAVGGFAAPLLAGAGFTLAVLALQSGTGLLRWPDAALGLLLAAGLLQIGTVQATAWTRRYMCTPEELLQWFPGEQTGDGTPSAFLLGMQQSQLRQAYRWANAARGFYHAGITALLAGLLVACVPPGDITGGRWMVLAVCGVGIVGELGWLVRAAFLQRGIRREVWLHLAVLLAALAAAVGPGLVPGGAVRAGSVLVLLLGLTLLARRRWITLGASLCLGAIALFFGVPQELVIVALAPALAFSARTLVALARRQQALRA